tara:strand:+ start:2983 stop:3684 length:702 start_codon:yes stop_codon:yes gene_type:complete
MTTSRTPYGFMLFVRLLVRMTIALLVSIPIIALGGILLVYSQTDGTVPAWSGIAAIATGLALLILGFYMTAVGSFPYPNLGEGEDVKIERHPTMKPAYARIFISIPLFFITAILYVATDLAYIFPFITFMVGLWFFFKGVMRYFRNLHITYIVTDRRAIYMYKFLYLHTNEIPVGRIVQISEKRTLIEALSGRGTVVVSSGIGSRMTINMEEIDNPGAVAEALRSMLPSTQNN